MYIANLEHSNQREPIYLRHHPIDDKEVVGIHFYHIECHLTIVSNMTIMSFIPQISGYVLSECFVVVDEKYFHSMSL